MADLSPSEQAVVGFDTATADTAVCAMRGGEVLYEELLGLSAAGSPRHSTALLAEVERAAAACGGWERVGRIAVGRGPGSFVGIRIGLATARGLSASTGLPAVGVCTLDALGRAIGAGLAVLDARRGEVFAALYGPAGERLWDPLVATPEALAWRLGELPAPPLAAGPGAIRFRDELASRDVDIPDDADPVHRIAARHICALAVTAGDGDGDHLDPIYLRPPDAQRWRERDTPQRAE
ncbi:MAG TPA: tRNA (adenosine(37)-N6)-threonylcarbamoyltransferase complex dimerization subunit type 1 TsaB [Solirubrobacterales bacterium]|nr:tRNA (adenosine(37)-N6)-threonylcarbamoyltransferase complex dimerization subunit type 1 TsaB [Solirubrobacterales bacterium]